MTIDLLDELSGACGCGGFLFVLIRNWGLSCAHVDPFNGRFLTGPFYPNQDQSANSICHQCVQSLLTLNTYNAGIKGKVDIKDGWFVGGDAQYMMALPRVEEKGTGLGFGDGVTYAYGEKMNATFQQWQVSAVVGKEIGSFTPYAGGTYSDLSLKSKHNLVPGFETNLNFQAKDHGGALVGTDYKVTSNISLNIEGQFINETSVSVSAKYKF